jgi:hypothetical protein
VSGGDGWEGTVPLGMPLGMGKVEGTVLRGWYEGGMILGWGTGGGDCPPRGWYDLGVGEGDWIWGMKFF